MVIVALRSDAGGWWVGSYVGLIPSEDSRADKQRLGHTGKQGNALLRFLLVEAAQAAARSDPEWRRRYLHYLAMRRQKCIAKVAMGRKLAVRLDWVGRTQSVEFGSYVGQLVTTGRGAGCFRKVRDETKSKVDGLPSEYCSEGKRSGPSDGCRTWLTDANNSCSAY
jgi:hypothetical protein